jgi:hypothetical protein
MNDPDIMEKHEGISLPHGTYWKKEWAFFEGKPNGYRLEQGD